MRGFKLRCARLAKDEAAQVREREEESEIEGEGQDEEAGDEAGDATRQASAGREKTPGIRELAKIAISEIS